MNNPALTKQLLPGAAIAAHRIVKFGAADAHCVQAAAAGDASIGVSDLGAPLGGVCSFITNDIAVVEYGGTITRGAMLTSDADGKAVVSTAGQRVIGIAMISGVAGDLGSVKI